MYKEQDSVQSRKQDFWNRFTNRTSKRTKNSISQKSQKTAFHEKPQKQDFLKYHKNRII